MREESKRKIVCVNERERERERIVRDKQSKRHI